MASMPMEDGRMPVMGRGPGPVALRFAPTLEPMEHDRGVFRAELAVLHELQDLAAGFFHQARSLQRSRSSASS
jgi:hypothetical protein